MNYQKIYNQIIERAKNRKLEGYVEKHHIIPKCIGGGDEKGNIVQLTAREHFICHLLLVEIYPENIKLKQALWLMAIGKNTIKCKHYKISTKIYEHLKLKQITLMKGNKYHLNKKHTEETKRKIGIANKKPKHPQTEEHKQKIGNNKIRNKRIGIARQKPIIQYDLDMNKIKEWPSAKIAATELNIDSGSITVCCKGRQKTAYKSIWKYKIN